MEYIENKKIEPERNVLYSAMITLSMSVLTGWTIGVFSGNFIMTNAFRHSSIYTIPIEIEQKIQEEESSLNNKIFFQNPVARAGRDLAYFLNKKE